MTSGNVSEAQKENRTQHHPFQHSPQDKELLPPKVLQSQQVNLSSVPRMGSTAIPGRGNPAARSDTDGLSLTSLSLVTGGNQHNLQLSCAFSHFTALHTSHSFMGRSLHITLPCHQSYDLCLC